MSDKTTQTDIVKDETPPTKEDVKSTSDKVVVETKTPKKAPVSQNPPESHEVKFIRAQLALYTDLMSGTTVPRDNLVQGVKKLLMITNAVLRSGDTEVLKVLYQYHLDHKDGLMDERHGLRGIESLGAVENMRVSILYRLFRRTATRSKERVDTNIAMKYINIHGKGADIIDFLNKKFNF